MLNLFITLLSSQSQEGGGFFQGILINLIAWVITLAISGACGCFLGRKQVQRKFRKKLSMNLLLLDQNIQASAHQNELRAIQNAKKIIELYETYQNNFSRVKELVFILRLEEIKELLEESEPKEIVIQKQLDILATTWPETANNLYNSLPSIELELGISKS